MTSRKGNRNTANTNQQKTEYTNRQGNRPHRGSSASRSKQQQGGLSSQRQQLRGSSKRQPLFARILARFIIITLVAGIVYLMTSNPWLGLGGGGIGAAIIAALGLVSNSPWWLDIIEWLEKGIQGIVTAILPGIRKRVKGYQRIVRIILLVIGFIVVLSMTFAVLLLAGWVQPNFPWQRSAQSSKNTPTLSPSPIATRVPSPTPPDFISVTTRGNSQVGISDGRYVFDMGFADNVVKKQAADAVNMHQYSNAQAILKEAQNLDPTDAEARIYQENARIRVSNLPHFTLIVVTTFKASDSKDQHETGTSRDILQGACLAQLTYNSANPAKQVMLFIANVPDPQIDATTVANQIIQAAGVDHTIVGVVGWPSGSDDAIETLGKAHIPVVSPTSLDITSGAGGYFFSVAPSINDQTGAAVTYAKSHWGANKAAVFYDPDDPHSNDLDAAFINNFRKAGGTVISNAAFSTDSPGELIRSANSLIAANPDLKFFYFAGYPSDAWQLLKNINAHDIHIIAGDGLSQMVHCPISVCPVGSLSGLYFTASALQDEVASLKLDQQALAQQSWLQLKSADFFAAYRQQFDTGNAGNAYNNGERASSDVTLAYDATSAFLYTSTHVNEQKISAQTMQQELKNIQNIYGVSGHISFGSDGNPQQKAVLLLWPVANEIKLQTIPSGYY